MNIPLNMHDTIKTIADENDIEPALVAAFVEVESSGNSLKTRYEPKYADFLDLNKYASCTGVSLMTERVQQATSWGLMQVMGATARGLGFKGLFPDLCYPEVGLHIGCMALVSLQRRFAVDIPLNADGILCFNEALACAYNMGHPEKDDSGMWVVEGYVSAIKSAYGQAIASGL